MPAVGPPAPLPGHGDEPDAQNASLAGSEIGDAGTAPDEGQPLQACRRCWLAEVSLMYAHGVMPCCGMSIGQSKNAGKGISSSHSCVKIESPREAVERRGMPVWRGSY